MAAFISYSHANSDFVDQLAGRLVEAQVSVWLDRWEMRVGDSILDRIQAGLENAGALLVVLSKASVESQWCKKELSAGLLRELEERKVVVLPILLEDCPVPLFLRDKLYADFRTDFERGLSSVLEGLAGVVSLDMARTAMGDFYTDWAQDWGESDGRSVFRYTLEPVINFEKRCTKGKFQAIRLEWSPQLTSQDPFTPAMSPTRSGSFASRIWS